MLRARSRARSHRRGGRLSDDRTKDPANKTPDYDTLLHRRKGLSGSEFAGIGIQFAVILVAFALAGIWLDKKLGTSPWLLLVGVLGGAGLGFWTMVRKAMGKK